MNGYICLHNRRKIEVYAESLYKAKEKAIEIFKPRRSQRHMVVVRLAEKDGEQVTHLPLD